MRMPDRRFRLLPERISLRIRAGAHTRVLRVAILIFSSGIPRRGAAAWWPVRLIIPPRRDGSSLHSEPLHKYTQFSVQKIRR